MGFQPFITSLFRSFDYSGVTTRSEYRWLVLWLFIGVLICGFALSAWAPALILIGMPLLPASIRRARDEDPERIAAMIFFIFLPVMIAFLYAGLIIAGEWLTQRDWSDLIFQIPVAVIAILVWGLLLVFLSTAEGSRERTLNRQNPDPDAERAAAQKLVSETSDRIAQNLGIELSPAAVTSIPPAADEVIAPTIDLLKALCSKYSNGILAPDFPNMATQFDDAMKAGGWRAASAKKMDHAAARVVAIRKALSKNNDSASVETETSKAYWHPKHSGSMAIIEMSEKYPTTAMDITVLMSDPITASAIKLGLDHVFLRSYPSSFRAGRTDQGFSISGSSSKSYRDGLSTAMSIQKMSPTTLESLPECPSGILRLKFTSTMY